VVVDATVATLDPEFLPGKTTVELLARNLTNSAGVMPGFSGVDYPVTQRSFFLQIRHGF
jgi:hypothetical protein